MLDPIETRSHDRDTTIMGPGFFVFFQRGIIEQGGEFYDGHPYAFKPAKFKFTDEEEKKAAPIIERIAQEIIESKKAETKEDIELILILRLEMQGLICKSIYLTWILEQRRRYNMAIALLLLN